MTVPNKDAQPWPFRRVLVVLTLAVGAYIALILIGATAPQATGLAFLIAALAPVMHHLVIGPSSDDGDA